MGQQKEPEPTIAGYLLELLDERADELKILKNENIYLKTRVYELERKFEEMEDEKARKAEIKKKRREKREKRKLRKQKEKIKVKRKKKSY